MIDQDSPTTIRLTVDQAMSLGRRSLVRAGFDEDDASAITDHLVDGMLCGYPYTGLPRILQIVDGEEIKRPKGPVTIVHETPLSAVIDGGNNTGYISVLYAAELGIRKARESGVAFVGVHNSWLSGRNAYYLEKVSRAGFVGIHTVSGPPRVVPPGALKPGLGTNPLAISIPLDPDPIIFDMGTAAMMGADLRLKAFLGESVPEGIGVDEMGNPTTSAREICTGGAILPIMGHKGYGLSLMIQMLDLLAGPKRTRGQVQDYGFFFIIFNPELMMPRDVYREQVAELIANIKALPRKSGLTEIRIPSERSYSERRIRMSEGVLLERRVYDRLNSL